MEPMRKVVIKTPVCRCGMRPGCLTGDIFRDTCTVDGREVELFRCEGERFDNRERDYFWSFLGNPEHLVLEWSTDPRDTILNGTNCDTHWEHPLYECYCGVLVRKDGEPCQHCEAEGITSYPVITALPDPEPPPMTDAEALAAIKRLRRYDDDLRALDANYKALKKETEGKRDRFLALEGERLQAWTASKLKGNRRSVRTLEGVASFRTIPGRVKVTNTALALEWARKFGEVVTETVERLPGSYLDPEQWRTIDNETGEEIYDPPAGLVVEPERTTFSVKSGAKAETETEGEERDDDE
jgi:hypothetical protein